MSNDDLQAMLDYAKDALEASGTSGNLIPFWNPKADGRFPIRILPATGDMEHFFVKAGNHWTTPKGGTSHRCPKITKGQNCLLCAFDELIAGKKDLRKKYNTSVKPRFYMNLLVYDPEYYESETPLKGAQQVIWDCAPTAFELLLDQLRAPDYTATYKEGSDDLALVDWEHGVDLYLVRETENNFPTYKSITPRPKTRNLKEAKQFKEWEENLRDLTKLVDKVATPAEMVREFNLISLGKDLNLPESELDKLRSILSQDMDVAPAKAPEKSKEAKKEVKEEDNDVEDIVAELERDSQKSIDLDSFGIDI